MEVQEMIADINARLTEENCKLKEQEIIVEELGKKYAEQLTILKVVRQNIRMLNLSMAELKKAISSKRKSESSNEETDGDSDISVVDERYEELTRVLNDAVNLCVQDGTIVEVVNTSNGTTLNMRTNIINRARNAIIRSNRSYYSHVEWVRNMTDDDILRLRNVGKKTGQVIRAAQYVIACEEQYNRILMRAKGDTSNGSKDEREPEGTADSEHQE